MWMETNLLLNVQSCTNQVLHAENQLLIDYFYPTKHLVASFDKVIRRMKLLYPHKVRSLW